MGQDRGTFETLKFSLQLLAELHLLQEQFLQLVCERGEWEVKERVCRTQEAPRPQVLPRPIALRWELGALGREVEALSTQFTHLLPKDLGVGKGGGK